MKVVQKLLSHGLLIGFFVASFFTYLYRAELFPQWFGDTTRAAALPGESQSVRANAPAGQPAGKVDSGANTGSPLPAKTAGETASRAEVTADLPPLMAPGGEAPTPDSRGMQGNTSDLPPLASASDVDQASPQPPAAAPDAAPAPTAAAPDAAPAPTAAAPDAAPAPTAAAPDAAPAPTAAAPDAAPAPTAAAPDAAPAPAPTAATGFSADRAWDSAMPPPARFRPLDAESDAAVPAPVEAAERGAVVASEPEQSNAAPPQDTVLIDSSPPAIAQATGESPANVAADRSADPVQMQPAPTAQQTPAPLAPAATAGLETRPMQGAAPVAVPAAGTQDFQQQLTAARTYFWRRDVRGALQAYQDLARVWPTQADAWGELGNLYLRIGNRPAAAEAYYRTMSILLDQGETGRAHDLLEVLYGLDAARASEMEKRFRQVSS